MKKEKSSSPFTDRAFGVSIKIDDSHQEDLPIDDKCRITSRVSDLSRRLFFALFSLIAGECLKDNYAENIEDEFGNVVDVLFKRFNLDNLDEKGSLEKSIREYILTLEKNLFFLPNDLVGLAKGKDSLKSLEFDVGYEGDLDSVVDCIRDILKALREEKITFWKKFFETYKGDKEAFDLGFRTKETRRKSDLEQFSKIDIDEYKDRLSSIGKKKS